MKKKQTKEVIKEEKKFKVEKFARPGVFDELTKQNVVDIIQGQEDEIKNLESQIEKRKDCIAHYKKAIK